MSTIQSYLNRIKTAVFGKDVRASIHDAIDLCYKHATGNPESVAAFANDLNETNENLRRVEADRENTHDVLIEHKNNKNEHTVGLGTETSNANEKAIGTYNKTNADQLFSVGNGTSENKRSNAMTVYKDGTVVASSFQLPNGNTVLGTDGIFTGYDNKYRLYEWGDAIQPGLTVFRLVDRMLNVNNSLSVFVDTITLGNRSYSPLLTNGSVLLRLMFTPNEMDEIAITLQSFDRENGTFSDMNTLNYQLYYFVIAGGPVG